MAAQKINYQNKVRGDLFTSANANEVKEAVNHNADEITTLQNTVSGVSRSLTQLSQSVTGLREETKIVKVQQTETTVAIDPNKMNIWGSVAALNITLTPGTAGIANEYMLQFTAASDNFTLTLSDTIRWAVEPEFQAGYTYYVSIQDGLGLCAGWEAAAS